ncbi:amidohydrolase family protein [Sarocladium strictum]
MADNDQPLLLPIIDSHIHLWPGAEHDTLAWNTPESSFHKQQRSVVEYKVAGSSSPSLLGYIFIETDRKNNHPDGEATPEDEKKSWEAPLQEIRWMRRLVLGEPEGEEGHEAADKKLCLGLVPWAPMVRGPEVLERYLAQAEEAAGEETWKKVKGFRYLVQDKPHGTMLTDEFIGSLKLLGRKGYTFDVGVDHHRRGKKQLEELVEMVGKAHEGVPEDKQVVLILNHLCKPDMSIVNTASDRAFDAWRTAMYTLSKANKTYMKLSGAFSEMPDSLRKRSDSPSHIFQSTLGWLGIVLATFGPSRTMFGSDWPVCTLNGLGDEAWGQWRDVVEKMCWMASLDDEERAMIFGGTAKTAYNL